jgi:hypothetical protein
MKEVEFLDEMDKFSRNILPDKVVGIYAMIGRCCFLKVSICIYNYPCVHVSVCRFVSLSVCLHACPSTLATL